MEPPLTTAEIVISILPIIIPIALFVVLPAGPTYGFTNSGRKYQKVDAPTHVPLLGKRFFWQLFTAFMAGAAVWALSDAVLSAVQSGTVSLPGRRKHPRPVVAWEAAWSYFLGLGCLLTSAIGPWISKQGSNARFWLTVLAVLLCVAGYVLVVLSPLLSSWQGVGVFSLLVASGLAHLWWRRRSSESSEFRASNDA